MNAVKKIALAASLLLMALILYCCFFQSPSMDDFVAPYLVKTYGWKAAVELYLTKGNGRFSSIPLFLAIGSNPFLMSHYWITLAVFVLIAFSVLSFMIWQYGHRHTTLRIRLTEAFIGGTALLLLILSCIPEPASFFFWMATSVTYLFGFILLILLYCLLFGTVYDRIPRLMFFLLMLLLKIAIAGTNELVFAFGIFSTFLLVIVDLHQKKIRFITGICIVVDLLLIVLFLNLKGNQARAGGFVQQYEIAYAAIGSFFRALDVFIRIFSSPLFWLAISAIPFLLPHIRPESQNAFKSKKTNLPVDLLLIFLPVFLFHFVIRYLGGEVLPERAVNLLIAISIVFLLFAAIANAVKYNYSSISLIPAPKHFVVVAAIIIITSPFLLAIPENLYLLPVHRKVLIERVSEISIARKKNQKLVFIKPYLPAFNAQLRKTYTWGPRNFRFNLPPSFSYFKDDPENPNTDFAYAEYYGIDSIKTEKSVVKRWGLTGFIPFTYPDFRK